MDVRNRVALVTGGGSGIGRATAQRLAREGASVAVLDRDAAGADATVSVIKDSGGSAIAVGADVTEEASLSAVVERLEDELGGLDILVNNAGVTSGQPSFPEAPSAQWGRTLDINLRAVILGVQLALPALIRRGGGAIVSTASLAGIMGFPPDPVYAASKGGVVLFTRSLAPLRESHNIRVNCVCPGFIDTPMLRRYSGDVPAERQAMVDALPKLSADEVADAIFSLIVDDSAAGQAVQVAFGLPRIALPAPSLTELTAGLGGSHAQP